MLPTAEIQRRPPPQKESVQADLDAKIFFFADLYHKFELQNGQFESRDLITSVKIFVFRPETFSFQNASGYGCVSVIPFNILRFKCWLKLSSI